MNTFDHSSHEPWNKGKLVGQKSPLRLRDIWAIRIRLQLRNKTRDLSLFNLAIDSKLRACDLVKLRVRDVPMEHASPDAPSCFNRKPSGRTIRNHRANSDRSF